MLDNNHALAGLACHEQQGWRLMTLISSESGVAASSSYRTAGSSLPAALMQSVDERMSGAPLDAAAEIKARRGGWR